MSYFAGRVRTGCVVKKIGLLKKSHWNFILFQIIPIESSMTGNRHLFAPFLYLSLTIFTGILGSIGIMGYMKFGDATQQIIVWNLPSHSVIPYILDSVICLGVMLTLPLMNYPVIEILEDLLFAEGT